MRINDKLAIKATIVTEKLAARLDRSGSLMSPIGHSPVYRLTRSGCHDYAASHIVDPIDDILHRDTRLVVRADGGPIVASRRYPDSRELTHVADRRTCLEIPVSTHCFSGKSSNRFN